MSKKIRLEVFGYICEPDGCYHSKEEMCQKYSSECWDCPNCPAWEDEKKTLDVSSYEIYYNSFLGFYTLATKPTNDFEAVDYVRNVDTGEILVDDREVEE